MVLLRKDRYCVHYFINISNIFDDKINENL